MGTKLAWAALCIAFLTTVTAMGTDSRLGPAGRAATLVIKGAEAFTPEAIREALFNELDVVAACDPDAPAGELETILADKAAAGYRAAGFFDVKVSVIASDDKLAMTIEEGGRYTNGEIAVSGTHHLDADKIKAHLTAQRTDGFKRRPLWRAAEPAAFGPESEAVLTLKVLTSADDQGCYRAQVKATVEPDRSTKQATLRIKFRDEGPLSTLGDVEMVGNERNSRQAVMAYLAIDAQAPLTRELCEQVERRLLASGRFLAVRWELGKREDRTDSWRPRLVVEDNDLAPPIDEPLTREEAALLKAAEWFERLEQSDEQVLFEQSGEGTLTVVASRRGLIVMLTESGADVGANDAPGFDYAIVMDEDRVGWYSRAQHGKLVARPPPSPVTGEATMHLIGGAPNWESEGALAVSAGLSTETHKGYRRHVNIHFKLTAPAALSVVRKHQATSRWDGDVVAFAWDKCQLRINARTGELIEHRVATGADDGEAASLRIVVRRGEFERRLAEIERATADWPNRADAQRPVSCVCEFVCRELEHFNAEMQRTAGDRLEKLDELFDDDDNPQEAELRSKHRQEMAVSLDQIYDNERRGYAALAKMISLGALEPVDKLAGQVNRLWKDDFPIPQPLFHVRAKSLKEFHALVRELAPMFGVRLGNLLFARDGNLNSAWRLGILAVAKKPIPLPYHFRRELGERGDPLSTFVAAELLRAAGAEFESKMYASDAGPSPSAAAFRNGCGELVSGEGIVSELLLKAAGIMRQLDVADIEALLQLCVEFDLLDQAQAAALELAALRAHVEGSPEHGAAKGLDALWRVGLSGWLERRLEEIRSPPGEPVGL